MNLVLPPDPAKLAFWINYNAQQAKLPDPLEVSALRLAHPISPAPWIVCFKSGAPDQPRRYAIFFKGNDVVAIRIAVLVDRCAEEAFTPLSK